ncbi:putative membrane protein At3g27390 [Silene latifolia]|uniref:putative membrane protein At3g27390 n=1 Tax=Silene latifolia TaxID=37657 RepID=UPI003D778F60
MEPPSGVLASVLQFLRFLPFFVGLLLLGIIKGLLLCPLVCLLMTVGISAITLGLWPVHFCWTFYCVVRAKQVGPVLKLVFCPFIVIVLILWPVVSIISSIVGGAVYGFLSPVFATFDAVGEGKTDEFYHSIYDGTWSTVEGCFTVIRDFRDVCFHSYFSIMDDLRQRGPPDAKYYEIRILYLPGAIIAGVFGLLIDFPVITLLAIFKSPYMLFKGWRRLIQDLIGREGPFLETICVPFAGLAIILWPLAVVGAVLGSMVSSVGLGAYAGVIAYQESSLLMGLHYIIAALAIYDEYSNDIIDMPEGSCFPRPHYRKTDGSSQQTQTSAPTLSRPNSFQKNLSRKGSLKNTMVELKPLELLDSIFKECHHQGDLLVSAGLISMKDVADSKSGKDKQGVISIGLPAYCILQTLLRSAKAGCPGLLLSDNITEITSTNRPKEAFFDWFFNPLLILKEQIKAENLSPSEEDYLGKLILLGGDSQRFRNCCTGNAPEDELKKAELEALARRLRGITTSITRFPTFRRRFENLTKSILENLAKKNGGSHQGNDRNGSGSGSVSKSRNGIVRFLSERSFKRTQSDFDSESLSHIPIEKDLEIQ